MRPRPAPSSTSAPPSRSGRASPRWGASPARWRWAPAPRGTDRPTSAGSTSAAGTPCGGSTSRRLPVRRSGTGGPSWPRPRRPSASRSSVTRGGPGRRIGFGFDDPWAGVGVGASLLDGISAPGSRARRTPWRELAALPLSGRSPLRSMVRRAGPPIGDWAEQCQPVDRPSVCPCTM